MEIVFSNGMKLTGLFSLIIVMCCLANVTHAQVLNSDNLRNVQVETLSDEEINTYYQKAKSAGFSDDQIFKMASDRGLPADQLTRLKERLSILSAGGSTTKASGTSQQKTDKNGKELSQEYAKPSLTKLRRDSTVFGSELFTETSSVFEPNFKIATPTGYVLGPGDELSIQVFGYSEQSYNPTVNSEGNIYIPNVGPIAVSGLSVDDASVKIKNKLAATIYKAIRSGQTRVQVSLGKIRSISVTIIGQAAKPGTYTVPSLTTLYNLLYLAGGPSDNGSFREIELVRGTKDFRKVDLYSFLLRGSKEQNVLLKDQDVIRIPYYRTRVSIEGEVRRPGKFEMLPQENIDQLLTYCGGFTDSAYRGMIKVLRVADTGRILKDVQQDDFSAYLPQPGDAFTVGKALNRFTNRVTLRGAVLRPGDYELKAGMQLSDLIREAGGLRPDAYTDRGVIARLKEDQTATSVSFNVKEILDGKQSVPLMKEDIVTVSSIFDLKDGFMIDVAGEVRKPGKVVYRDNLLLKDLLLMAGGFTEGADLRSVEISRRMSDVDVSSQTYRQAELIKVDMSAGLNADAGNIALKPFDLVLVRPRGSYERQRSVTLVGQVLSPGQFVLESSKDRISNLIRRAGGFKSSADSSAITIRRITTLGISAEERQRMIENLLSINRDSLIANPELRDKYLRNVDFLSVNVEKIKDNFGGPEDLILEEGDYIEVARASSLVRVSGEVYHPTLLPYEPDASAKYYIKRSGNFTSKARRSKSFVIYPDGRAKSVKRFLFFKSYPSVTARSEVFVPSKDQEGKKGMSTGEWIAISSVIASLATMAVTIVNAFK